MKRVYFFIFSVLLISLLFSCQMFNADVKNYLKEYTENAAVEVYELDGEYPKDKDGFICLSSDSEKKITFTMRNPQAYDLNIFHTFKNAESVQVKASSANSVSVSQSSSDKSIFYATFSAELLTKLDCGGDFTSEFELQEPKSMRSFNPYELILKVNSVPQAVKNLTMLQNPATGKYVLAFNMPDLTGIHKDIVSITINDASYPVAPNGKDDYTGLSGGNFTTTFSNFLPAMANGAEFNGKEAARAVYFLTDVAMQTEEYPFTVTLTDSAGLSASSKVSANSEQLENITFNPASPDMLEQDANGYGHITITAPASNPDAIVYYNVYYSNGTVYKQGGKKGSLDLSLGVGRWKVEAWAHKEGYMDSASTTVSPSVQGFVYVNPSYNGAIKDGGKETPYTSIESAVSGAGDFAGSILRMYLLNDCSVDKTVKLSGATIIEGGKKISGSAEVAFEIANEKDFTLNSVTVEKGIKFGDKSTLTLNGTSAVNGNVTLENDATVILNDSTKIGGSVTSGNSVTITMNDSNQTGAITAGTSGKITLNKTSSVTGAVKIGDSGTLNLKDTSKITGEITIGSSATLKAEGTNSFGGAITAGAGGIISLSASGSVPGDVKAGENGKITLVSTTVTGDVITGDKGSIVLDGSSDIKGTAKPGKEAQLVIGGTSKVAGSIALPEKTTMTLQGSPLVTDVEMAQDSLIKYNNLTGTTKFGTITHSNPSYGLTIIESADGSLLTADQVLRFTLNNPGYFLDIDNGKGKIKISGVLIVQDESSQIVINITGLNESAVAGIYTATRGDTISVEFRDENGNAITPDSVSIDLQDIFQDAAPVLTSTESSITFTNTIRAENYNLMINCTYKGKSYRKIVIVSVS